MESVDMLISLTAQRLVQIAMGLFAIRADRFVLTHQKMLTFIFHKMMTEMGRGAGVL